MPDDRLDASLRFGSRRISRRGLLTGAGGAVLATTLIGIEKQSAAAFAQDQATPQASPTTGEPEIAIGLNLAAIGPLPIDDLSDYGIDSIQYHTPIASGANAGFVSYNFIPSLARAFATAQPEIGCSTTLVSPATQDTTLTKRSIESLILRVGDQAATLFGAVAAVLTDASPDDSVGDQGLAWSPQAIFQYADSPTATTAAAQFFVRGSYAVLLRMVDVKDTVAPDDLRAVAQAIDARLSSALAGTIPAALQPVIPVIDYANLIPTPAFATALSSFPSVQITMRAIDGQLLRLRSESDEAFALAQGDDEDAAREQYVTNYKTALDQKATIVLATLNRVSDRGRDVLLRAYLPEIAKQVDNRAAGASITIEHYSLPPEGDADAIVEAISRRLDNDLDFDYTDLPDDGASTISALRALPNLQTSDDDDDAALEQQIEADFKDVLKDAETARKSLNKTKTNSSNTLEQSVELIKKVFQQVYFPVILSSRDFGMIPGKPFVNLATEGRSEIPVTINRVQLSSLQLPAPAYTGETLLSMEDLGGALAADLRAVNEDITDHALAGFTYQYQLPVPTTPLPPPPVMGDLTTVPFVGLAGAAPFPAGNFAKYVLGTSDIPTLSIPIGIQNWGDQAATLNPSPLADVVYNLPLSLAHVSSMSAPTSDPNELASRKIRTFMMIDPVSPETSWDAIAAAVADPIDSPTELGERTVAWTLEGESDLTARFSPFKGAGLFFQRGPFGVIVEIRSYSGNDVELKSVVARAKPIDKLLKAALAGKPSAAGLLGIPTFGPSEVTYISTVQQVRAYDGNLIGDTNDNYDPATFEASKQAWAPALASKATVVTSLEPVPAAVVTALFTGDSGAAAPAGLSLSFVGELDVLADDATAATFSAAFIDRLTAKHPDATVAALPSTGSGADEMLFATLTPNTPGYGSSVVAQRTIGARIGVAELSAYAYDLTQVNAEALAANPAFLAGTASIADQIAAGTNYLFTVGPAT